MIKRSVSTLMFSGIFTESIDLEVPPKLFQKVYINGLTFNRSKGPDVGNVNTCPSKPTIISVVSRRSINL